MWEFITKVFGYLFSTKKSKLEEKNIELSTIEKIINIWKDAAEKLDEEVKKLREEVRELFEENTHLREEISKLRLELEKR